MKWNGAIPLVALAFFIFGSAAHASSPPSALPEPLHDGSLVVEGLEEDALELAESPAIASSETSVPEEKTPRCVACDEYAQAVDLCRTRNKRIGKNCDIDHLQKDFLRKKCKNVYYKSRIKCKAALAHKLNISLFQSKHRESTGKNHGVPGASAGTGIPVATKDIGTISVDAQDAKKIGNAGCKSYEYPWVNSIGGNKCVCKLLYNKADGGFGCVNRMACPWGFKPVDLMDSESKKLYPKSKVCIKTVRKP